MPTIRLLATKSDLAQEEIRNTLREVRIDSTKGRMPMLTDIEPFHPSEFSRNDPTEKLLRFETVSPFSKE